MSAIDVIIWGIIGIAIGAIVMLVGGFILNITGLIKYEQARRANKK